MSSQHSTSLSSNTNVESDNDINTGTHVTRTRTTQPKTLYNRFLGQFDPYNFIFNMGVGMSSNLLYQFPYYGHWLRICSYIMFGINVLIFLINHTMFILHLIFFTRKYSFRQYFNKYFRNLSKNVFWGTYPMGLVTIINYLNDLAQYFYQVEGKIGLGKRLMILVYILWWYDIIMSIFIAWGITFIIWQNYYFHEEETEGCITPTNRKWEKMAAEHIKSVLLLAVIPMVVSTSSVSIFIMSKLATNTLHRNIQLLTMILATVIWLHAIIFVMILIGIYFWSLYVFKIPPMSQVFTMFLVLGPMGQGAYGILLITNNIKLYTQEYYLASETNLLLLITTIPWCFKILGLILNLSLLSMGFFFTIITLVAMISYSNKKTTPQQRRLYHYHQGFWGATFPMGTMSLGCTEVYRQFNQYVPMDTFRVLGVIYASVSVIWTLFCLSNTIWLYSCRSYNAVIRTKIMTRNEEQEEYADEMKVEPIVSLEQPETDFSFMREDENDPDPNDLEGQDLPLGSCYTYPQSRSVNTAETQQLYNHPSLYS